MLYLTCTRMSIPSVWANVCLKSLAGKKRSEYLVMSNWRTHIMRGCSNQQSIRQFGPQTILRMNNESTGTSNATEYFWWWCRCEWGGMRRMGIGMIPLASLSEIRYCNAKKRPGSWFWEPRKIWGPIPSDTCRPHCKGDDSKWIVTLCEQQSMTV